MPQRQASSQFGACQGGIPARAATGPVPAFGQAAAKGAPPLEFCNRSQKDGPRRIELYAQDTAIPLTDAPNQRMPGAPPHVVRI